MGKKKTRWKPFEEWLRQEVETEFGLNRVFEADYLHDFIADLPTLTPEEHQQAEALRKKLAFFADSWNEDDLKINFIGQILQIIDFQELKYRIFYNVFLKTTLKGEEIAGRVDGVLAKGSQLPSKPLFFLQEYKPEKSQNSDPLGQLLIAMLAAQTMNEDENELLVGCYIMGRNWFFVLLNGKEYGVSPAFVASQSDVFTIVALLKKIKKWYVEKYL